MPRLHYLDNLRWMSILLLFPVHAAVVFSTGWFGYYVTSDYTFPAALWIIVSIMPWLMPLLFCGAGMSTKFALRSRTPEVYLKERVTRLLVPFLAGLVLLCPVLAYYGLKSHTGYTGSYWDAAIYFFSTITSARDPTGFTGEFNFEHLWFILYLFVISVVALGVILLGKRQTWFRLNPGRVSLPAQVLLFFPLWLMSALGPGESGYSLVAYFFMFLIGYYLFSQDAVQERLERYWSVLVAAWFLLTFCMIVFSGGILSGNLTLVDVIASPLSPLAGWVGVLALLGTGRHLMNTTNPLTAYLGAASYPVYILHQPILVAVAWYILMWAAPPAVQFVVIVVFSVLLTFACYEILRRIPIVRVLFGIADPGKKTG